MRVDYWHILATCARRLVACGVTAVVIACGLTFAPPATSASTELLSCGGTGSNTFQPGVNNTPRTVTVHSEAHYQPCTGTSGITSGHYELTAAGTVSCLGGAFTITFTITWNTGQTSTITAIGVLVLRPANETVVLYHGTVTAGTFAGATVLQTAAVLNATPEQCFTEEGVTGTSGVAAIAITQSS
ncbi:MAG TPA: hypothetical protein VGX25_22440 [Actinophytocola sp.]|uniref:hypothetical protein n=1 Tax=Actinophytocola sp. TaxID=1872138 RepID=UPI002DDD4CD9|nr:hypothetical protein [Actinophytocola sp.]HEV2782161.1 hypothetical protein [Actinophytocola sp.]